MLEAWMDTRKQHINRVGIEQQKVILGPRLSDIMIPFGAAPASASFSSSVGGADGAALKCLVPRSTSGRKSMGRSHFLVRM